MGALAILSDLAGHYYSVPYRYAGEQLDVRYTQHTIEIFHWGQRIAAHGRSKRRGHHSTVRIHMPANRQAAMKEWNLQRLVRWASDIGPPTAAVIEHLLGSRCIPSKPTGAAWGVLNMARRYGKDRLEAACCRAIELKVANYQFIASTLKNGLESTTTKSPTTHTELPLMHANVCGPSCYHQKGMLMLHHPTPSSGSTNCACTATAATLAEQQSQDSITQLGFEERLGLLVEREPSERRSRRVTAPASWHQGLHSLLPP